MPRSKLSDLIQQKVRDRARHLCEYCHASEQWQYVPFTIDHWMPLSLGGNNDLQNLALACFQCNRRKTNRVTAIDPITTIEVPLFNPRQDLWTTHFTWSEDKLTIVGLTATGRATVLALAMNRDRVIAIRSADLEIGRHPPAADLI